MLTIQLTPQLYHVVQMLKIVELHQNKNTFHGGNNLPLSIKESRAVLKTFHPNVDVRLKKQKEMLESNWD
ncbi:hypothetical protein P4H70_06750 [Paenibacillus ehimensis]|uniref:hypothetical protein n=1 Tax=Paenibacillus ehimensis TaxID=79264 RepID=UPI002C12ED0D|nr:hypothetical protein [Paenibacillus ehimensis]MEC0208645.1 hypothetical protein [Paenibacillus ehimensis]HWO95602.1 hypothetical protein [Bacillus sp. (in: firmicutes)]